MSQHIPQTTTWKSAFLATLPVFLLVGAIAGSALSVSYGVFEYREAFKALQALKKERTKLNLDWTKLLIEQQTYGATTQIAGRAVTALHMYSPPVNDTVTLSAVSSNTTPLQSTGAEN